MAEKAREVSVKLHKWLTEEMGYQGPQRYGPLNHMRQIFSALHQPELRPSRKAPPSVTDISRLCRGNIIPVWQFLATRVVSDRFAICAVAQQRPLTALEPPKRFAVT